MIYPPCFCPPWQHIQHRMGHPRMVSLSNEHITPCPRYEPVMCSLTRRVANHYPQRQRQRTGPAITLFFRLSGEQGKIVTASNTQQDMEVLAVVPRHYGRPFRLGYPAGHPAPVSPSLAQGGSEREREAGEHGDCSPQDSFCPPRSCRLSRLPSRKCPRLLPFHPKRKRTRGSLAPFWRQPILHSCCGPEWWARGRRPWPPRL